MLAAKLRIPSGLAVVTTEGTPGVDGDRSGQSLSFTTMSTLIARRCFVSGRVQGVFYRASARERARALGVSGHAHNLADGRVEVLMLGEAAAVQSLTDWLSIGPPAAQVSAVEVSELSVSGLCEMPQGFTTR